MQITLIRHLPTEWNKKEQLQGRKDIEISPPSQKTINEIFENKKNLKKLEPFNYILSSTLKRTQQTANLYGYQPKVEPLIDEFDFGPFEGKPKDSLLHIPKKKWIDSPLELNFGEGIFHLQKRIAAFLEKYKSATSLLLFSHGTWTRALISCYKYGHVNNMNKITVHNNECITLIFVQKENKKRNGGLNLDFV